MTRFSTLIALTASMTLAWAGTTHGATLIGPDTHNGNFSDGGNFWSTSQTRGSPSVDYTDDATITFDSANNPGGNEKIKLQNNNWDSNIPPVQPGDELEFIAGFDYDYTNSAIKKANFLMTLKWNKTGGGTDKSKPASGFAQSGSGSVQETVNFTAPSDFDSWNTTRFELEQVTDGSDYGTMDVTFDNASLEVVIPEPASLALLSLGGLLVLPRRRTLR